MSILSFPPIQTADRHGLLAIGGDLTPESLELAYQNGIFPWPISSDLPLAWFTPDPRGVLLYENLQINRTLKKFLRKDIFTVKFNENFEEVIFNCAKVKRSEQNSTWITDDIINAYIDLFHLKRAYSVEVYFNNSLVGGIYGVCFDGIVTGESMFHTKSNASKTALVYLMRTLEIAGVSWLDTQMVTPVIKNLGGIEIPRKEFLRQLKGRKRIERDEIFSITPQLPPL